LCEHGFADAIGPGQHNVGGIIEKVERHQCLDGQPEAVTFLDASDAAQHITSWDSHNNPAEYSFVTVQATDYASIASLKAAGLADLLGDMEIDALRYAEPAGSA
jgi:hypothetical protein